MYRMKKQTVLIFTNIITLLCLVIISVHYKIPQKIIRKITITENSNQTIYSHYDIRNALFLEYYNKKYRIVMLGDSITERTAWNELLGIPDIANRGIDGDITEGFYNRLPNIYKIKPELCFIMGGINDIRRGISVEIVISNMKNIIDELEKNGIKPIIQSTLYISMEMPNWKK